MRGPAFGMFGVLLAVIAGFIAGSSHARQDPELWTAVHHGLLAWAFLLLIAGGVAMGRRAPSQPSR